MTHAVSLEWTSAQGGAAQADCKAMIHINENGLRPGNDPGRHTPRVRQNGSRRDRRAERLRTVVQTLSRPIVALAYAAVQLLMQFAAHVYFRRIEVLSRDHFPNRGPALLAVNHPSTWADVVVLDVALERKLHYIAHEPLFHPWPRKLLLQLFGSLPVRFHQEGPHARAANRETFTRAHELFSRGEVLVFFPEGISQSDHALLPLKTGAARLMLEGDPEDGRVPKLLPVAMWYEDRAAFRGDVILAIGEPIDPGPERARSADDHEEAAHALTTRIARALEDSLARAEAHAAARAGRDAPAHAWLARFMAPIAFAGRVLHALPAAVIEALTRRFAAEPAQVAFSRIGSGALVLLAWYACLVALAVALGGGWWLALPIAAPVLGWFACLAHDRRLPLHSHQTTAGGGHAQGASS